MKHAKIVPTDGESQEKAKKKSLEEVFADYDGNENLSSDASSELSDPQQAHIKTKHVDKYEINHHGDANVKKAKSGKKEGRKGDEEQKYESKFLEMRNDIKEKVMQNVMENVLPDIGAYDMDAMADKQVATKHWKITESIIKMLKMIGVLKYSLHELVFFGRIEDVEQLVADLLTGEKPQPELLNQYDTQGRTAISLAAKTGREEIVYALLVNGALPDIYDEDSGRTPMFYSVSEGHRRVTKELINFGASVDLADYNCVSPLMVASSKDDKRHCSLLVKHRADIDAQDVHGWTALHYAAFANSIKCTTLLLSNGANMNLADLNGRKPRDVAKFKKHKKVGKLLRNWKAHKTALVDDDDSDDEEDHHQQHVEIQHGHGHHKHEKGHGR